MAQTRKTTQRTLLAQHLQKRKNQLNHQHQRKKVAGGDLKDGTYKLEEKNEKNGYRAVFEMTVKDGKITESKYDNINADNKSKTEDTKYEESMKAKSGVG